ncbi:MAG: UvrD-helicase domain-containing protein [Ruminococcus sp.]|jgi:DNA helicase-2/ATP-dependent DNA helicase PcrA|nr:UvrD-helicase domain-containing protein [Ruminococcus sp.]
MKINENNENNEIFSHLNEPQKMAVNSITGQVQILAGAGSGKTTVIVNRIMNMIRFCNIMPWNILVITFTNKAAKELQDRLEKNDCGGVSAYTFHGFCARILRINAELLGLNPNYTIYDGEDSLRIVKSCINELGFDIKMTEPKKIKSEISRAKDNLLSPSKFESTDFRSDRTKKIYVEYQRRLHQAGAVDFDDLIYYTVWLFKKFPEVLSNYQEKYKYISVDEFQDTSYAQFVLVCLLAQKYGNLCVVGDDDQSIYKFRGATVDNILKFDKFFPNVKVIKLEQNYRSTQVILNAANSVIKNNISRKEKKLWTNAAVGEKIKIYNANTGLDEGDFIADIAEKVYKRTGSYSDFAILYRINALSQVIEKKLVEHSIPYRVYGGLKFYSRKEIKDILAYMTMIVNPFDLVAFSRIINEPKRGIGPATVAKIAETARQENISLLEVLKRITKYRNVSEMFEKIAELPYDKLVDGILTYSGYKTYMESQGDEGKDRLLNVEELKSAMLPYDSVNDFLMEIALYTDLDSMDENDGTVSLMTIHSAKGLEFDTVLIAGMEDGIFPGKVIGELEEERRLAYVAMTRAKRELFLTYTSSRVLYGKSEVRSPSDFISEIDKRLIESKSQENKFTNKTKVSFGENNRAAGINSVNKTKPVMSKNTSSVNYKIGDAVEHTNFGNGTIVGISGSILEIMFDKSGTRKVMKSFSGLKLTN